MPSRLVSVTEEGIVSINKEASFSACVHVVYIKTIIHLSVSESGRYLPSRFANR